VVRFELEFSKANKPRRLFMNRFERYDDMWGGMTRGVMARVGYVFAQIIWG